MTIAQRQAQVLWEGMLASGAGTMSTWSGALEPPVTWAARTEQPDGKTSPEELIPAAYASCFAMALALVLGEDHVSSERLTVNALCTLDEVDGALRMTGVDLTVLARASSLDEPGLARSVGTRRSSAPFERAAR
jgi:lipoyl-dependent peroxiredoxin